MGRGCAPPRAVLCGLAYSQSVQEEHKAGRSHDFTAHFRVHVDSIGGAVPVMLRKAKGQLGVGSQLLKTIGHAPRGSGTQFAVIIMSTP